MLQNQVVPPVTWPSNNLLGERKGDSNVFVAVGLLSTAKKNTKANATVSLGRRTIIRQSNQRFRATLGPRVVVRFLIARNGRSFNSSSSVAREAEAEGDILFLNMTEAKHRCALKYWLWFKLALPLFPTARYFMLGDDDIYVQLAHLEADLQNVHVQTQGQHVLWGLIMWKAYYNNNTMETSTGFTGWDFFDWAAVAQRRAMKLCRHATRRASSRGLAVNRTTAPACYIIRNDHREAVLAGHMDPLPPFPYINGPLFGVSRSLAAMLSASRFPSRWISQLGRNKKTVDRAEKLWGFSCWPVGDSVLGFWVASVALKRQAPVTLVNTPFMGQHLPWPSWQFSNRSIVLHGLRTEKQTLFREEAIRRGSGEFEAYYRTCDSCQQMGWTTWPDSPMNQWRCCGKRLDPGRRVRACVGKQCPRVDKQTLLAVANAKDPPEETSDKTMLSPAARSAAADQVSAAPMYGKGRVGNHRHGGEGAQLAQASGKVSGEGNGQGSGKSKGNMRRVPVDAASQKQLPQQVVQASTELQTRRWQPAWDVVAATTSGLGLG